MADVLACFPLVAAQLLYCCDATSGDIVEHLSGTCNYCLSLWLIKACSKLYTFPSLHLKSSMFRYTGDQLEFVKRLVSEMFFFSLGRLFTFVWSRNVLRDCGSTGSVSGCCVAARKTMICHGSPVTQWVWRSQNVDSVIISVSTISVNGCCLSPSLWHIWHQQNQSWNDKSIMSEWWVEVRFPLNWILD